MHVSVSLRVSVRVSGWSRDACEAGVSVGLSMYRGVGDEPHVDGAAISATLSRAPLSSFGLSQLSFKVSTCDFGANKASSSAAALSHDPSVVLASLRASGVSSDT